MEGNTNTAPADLLSRAVIVSLEIHAIGTSRTVAEGEAEVRSYGSIVSDGVRVTKEILRSDRLEEIRSLDGEIRRRLDGISLPFPLRRGCYLIPDVLYPTVDGMIERYREARSASVAAFVEEYDAAQASARDRLGPLYSPSDYPPAERVRAAFRVESRTEVWGVPDRLEKLSAGAAKRERERVAREIRDASAEVRDALRAGLRDLVSGLLERLEPTADGKPKVLRGASVDNLQTMLSMIEAYDVTGDAELRAVAEQARKVMSGVDRASLKNAPIIRAMVKNGLAPIAAKLGELSQQTTTRRFNFAALRESDAAGKEEPNTDAA